MDLALNNLQRLICHKIQTTNKAINHTVVFLNFILIKKKQHQFTERVLRNCFTVIITNCNQNLHLLSGVDGYMLTLLLKAQCDTRSIFINRVHLVWIQSFPYPRLVASSQPYVFPIAGGRRDGFMPFPRAFAWSEMQSVPRFKLRSTIPLPMAITVILNAHSFKPLHYEYDVTQG